MNRVLVSLALLLTVPFRGLADDSAATLLAHAREGRGAWEIARHLTDRIGPRLSGSANAEKAVAWTAATMRAWGLEVRLQPVTVPHWVRGREEAKLTSPTEQALAVTALGGSIATPPEGITAPVIEVRSYEELRALGETVRGKIVFYNRRMDPELVAAGRSFEAYRLAVEFRGTGAVEAAKLGAVAAVIRSVASHSLRTPHTGSTRYDDEVPKIPAAAVSTEDADLLERLLARDESVAMHLLLTPQQLPDVESANVIAEIRGSEKPEEIVVIGGHLDSWDLGTGAIDNASGIAMTMETMRVLHAMKLRPRRTIRAVLFMNEENGTRGGRKYAAEHLPATHYAAIESDAGTGEPRGFTTTLEGEALQRLLPKLGVLEAIGANRLATAAGTGADTSHLTREGVVGFGVASDNRLYFAYHHSAADTLDKIDPQHLQQNAAAMAVLTWVLANEEGPLR
ncbi:MAG TPA: M20/M25/M40 family metallo-hydrolase [Thermoanaerobaculia bacterium]|nr:M20/M25/M40 family metallo-hydrolase [Thermoanaerobaculia bacterium]